MGGTRVLTPSAGEKEVETNIRLQGPNHRRATFSHQSNIILRSHAFLSSHGLIYVQSLMPAASCAAREEKLAGSTAP